MSDVRQEGNIVFGDEHNLSATAQEILLYAITNTHLHFRTFVEPLISEGADDATLRRVILESVITPTMTDLEENVLALMPDELEGIIWYLTANCFVTWVRNAELPPSA